MRETSYRLSSSEKDFIRSSIASNIRIDGREKLQKRKLQVITQVLPQASGSSAVVIDATNVLVGIQAQIGEPLSSSPDAGHFVLSVDCSPSSLYSTKNQLESFKQHLTEILLDIISNCRAFDLSQLSIAKGTHCWILYIDVFVLSDGGNVVEAAFAAIRAALFSLKLPSVTWEEDLDHPMEVAQLSVSNNPDDVKLLNTRDLPYLFTVAKIGSICLFDPLKEEEFCADCVFFIAVNAKGNILYIKKIGNGLFTISELMGVVKMAIEKGVKTLVSMDEILSQHRHTTTSKLSQIFQ